MEKRGNGEKGDKVMAREPLTREEVYRDFGKHQYLATFGFSFAIHDRWLDEAYDLVGEKEYNRLSKEAKAKNIKKWN